MSSQLVDDISDTYNESTEESDENMLKILVATDIHLGYAEKDPIRCNDSFNTFEEILQIAAENNVDFMLLGGDLFHESKPSTICYHRCISLLKKYCLGDKAIALQFLSDPSKNFSHLKNPLVNYEDPNINIEIPVFSIHGNHDDPTGESNLSAMDILADTGLVNYFGKWTDLNKIEIYPLLIKKGETQLALYGLSHIKDERLSRLFKDKKVTMTRPIDAQNWFNILVLHQNRAQNRGIKNYIPESVIPDFIDLVIWGHEHDCRIDPEDTGQGVYISQPGSSVATSLALGESLDKYIGVLKIARNKFCLDKVRLTTVRPFVFRDLELSKPAHYDEASASEYAKNKIKQYVEEMLQEAQKKRTPNSPELPLLRLVVNFTDDTLISNAIRLGQNYRDKVANPVDMLSFKLRKGSINRNRKNDDPKDIEEFIGDQLADSISDFVEVFFKAKNQHLNVLSTKGLCQAVSRFIDRNDTDAIDDIVNHQYNKTKDRMMKLDDVSDENFQAYLDQFRAEREENPNDEAKEFTDVLENEKRLASKTATEDLTLSSDDDDATVSGLSSMSTTSLRGTASTRRPARGRGSRGPRAPRRARGRAT